jgi:transcriptional regulator with PAS, ATPase and Fis domain
MFTSIVKNYFTSLLPSDSFGINNIENKLEITLKNNEAKKIINDELKKLFSTPIFKDSSYLNIITKQKNKPEDYVTLLNDAQNNKISISFNYDDAFLKLAVFSSPFKNFPKICKAINDKKDLLNRGEYFFNIYTYEIKNVQKMFCVTYNITSNEIKILEINDLFRILKSMKDDNETNCD